MKLSCIYSKRVSTALAGLISEDVEEAIISKLKQLIVPPKSSEQKWQVNFYPIPRKEIHKFIGKPGKNDDVKYAGINITHPREIYKICPDCLGYGYIFPDYTPCPNPDCGGSHEQLRPGATHPGHLQTPIVKPALGKGDHQWYDRYEAAVVIDFEPIGEDPLRFIRVIGPIQFPTIIRTEANGIMAFSKVSTYGGDSEVLFGDEYARGVMFPTTFEELASEINERAQEWAAALDIVIKNPEHHKEMIEHVRTQDDRDILLKRVYDRAGMPDPDFHSLKNIPVPTDAEVIAAQMRLGNKPPDPPKEISVTMGMRELTDIEGQTVLRLRKTPESYESWEAIVAEVERALGVAYEVDPADLDDADYEVTLLRVDRHDHLVDNEPE